MHPKNLEKTSKMSKVNEAEMNGSFIIYAYCQLAAIKEMLFDINIILVLSFMLVYNECCYPTTAYQLM